MPTIDADAHVIETERTWEYLDQSERKFRPRTVSSVNDPRKRFWLIDGRRVLRAGNVGPDTSETAREMKDIEARLRHMDRLGVDIQVLYPSLFLSPLTARPKVERGLARSYNRWLADIWRKGENRLRWAAVVPTLDIEHALAEARFAKDNGACALYLRAGPHGSVGIAEKRLASLAPPAAKVLARGLRVRVRVTETKSLADPYFYPLYEEASRLNLAICIHASTGSQTWREMFEADSGFSKFKLPVISTFHSLAYHGIPSKFPRLRFGFIEVGAQWVPYVLHDLAKRFERTGKRLGQDFMRGNRLYVACQTSDDLAYVLRYAGENNIVIGTDYGHGDTSAEIEALRRLKTLSEVSSDAIEKILSSNPRDLYNL
jgi:predicted TIM-barrel fold metal-dependent hydrolase